MAITGAVEIKVTPSDLRNKASLVRTEVGKMKEALDDLETKLNATSSYWIGEAGDLHRKLYQDEKPNVENMISTLLEHTTDLEAIADQYEGVEREVTAISESLDTNALE